MSICKLYGNNSNYVASCVHTVQWESIDGKIGFVYDFKELLPLVVSTNLDDFILADHR